MRVAFHAVAGPRGGPRTYAVALAEALHVRDDVELIVLTDRPDAFPGMETVLLQGPKPWADHVVVPWVLRKLKPDVYHNTKNALPLRLSCPEVVTVHDLAYVHFPETFTPAARSYIAFHTKLGVKRARRIVCVSNHARDDLVRTLGVQEDRIDVIHHGVAPCFRAPMGEPPAGLAKPYVLSVGTIQSRKNLDILVRAAALLRENTGLEFTLVIAGRRGWKTKAFDDACGETEVEMLGMVSDASLPALYRHAAVFVQPSSYEGFGLTAAEAMACGTPVIAADAGSLPEVVGDTGLLVPPRDVAALADAIESVLTDPRDLGERGRARSERFTWEHSARRHAAVYRQAAGSLVRA